MGENLTVKELLKKIIKASKNKFDYPIIQKKSTRGDSFGFRSSSKKLLGKFNYKPRYNLDKGLEKYFKWIKKIPIKKNLKPYHPLKNK